VVDDRLIMLVGWAGLRRTSQNRHVGFGQPPRWTKGAWYNLPVMRRGTDVWRRVWPPALAGLFFAATIMAPAYGPIVDHHYAERLLFHSHLADSGPGPHRHAFLVNHAHPMQPGESPDLATAIPGDDGLPSSPVGAGHADDLALRSNIEPPVELGQPTAYFARPGTSGPPPPLRPPIPSA